MPSRVIYAGSGLGLRVVSVDQCPGGEGMMTRLRTTESAFVPHRYFLVCNVFSFFCGAVDGPHKHHKLKLRRDGSVGATCHIQCRHHKLEHDYHIVMSSTTGVLCNGSAFGEAVPRCEYPTAPLAMFI